MREHLGFLKTSSVVVKVAAWIFLCIGIIGGVSVLLGFAPEYPRWMGAFVIVAYLFAFCFLYIIARISDLLIKLINDVKKS